ncbi:hypothetical protein [Bradyrhizobium acaciae]|uniref:hypothetical protein n=1 Tax=Bradyrhizobium acaciae TaxID=2683706 RepID=UPI001E28D90B|nr:hypothetical protein [Bradyrhizobium acaciae]MCC8984789.1 hypothetical protein [Bradyrhizobium acaciae]
MSNTTTRFDNARLKVKRAEQHIMELKRLSEAFYRTDFCKLKIEVDPRSGENILKLESIAVVPIDLSLVIGDTAHNLRSAFDYISTSYVGKDNNRITFPAGQTREQLLAGHSFREINKGFPKFATFIADKIQPYKGGIFKVWEIGRLDNFDKHKLLLPTTSIQAITGVDAEDENHNVITNMTLIVDQGGVVHGAGTNSKLTIKSRGRPIAEMLFPSGAEVFENRPVIPTLLDLSQAEGHRSS